MFNKRNHNVKFPNKLDKNIFQTINVQNIDASLLIIIASYKYFCLILFAILYTICC
jgi:hypothetical protein